MNSKLIFGAGALAGSIFASIFCGIIHSKSKKKVTNDEDTIGRIVIDKNDGNIYIAMNKDKLDKGLEDGLYTIAVINRDGNVN